MKAPEKLYLVDDDEVLDLFPVLCLASTEKYDNEVEYIRKDAFIEKAEKFFTEKFEAEDYDDIIDIDGSPIFNYGRFIEDFKNYMENKL